jgi:ergothioneine biosynthesis protein EgtB
MQQKLKRYALPSHLNKILKMNSSQQLTAYQQLRRETTRLAAPLSAEDQQLQASPDASPTKWHQAHTTWFFETFLLLPHGVPPVSAEYQYLFNSYYDSIGPRHPRPQRGLLSRPSLKEVEQYRARVDEQMLALLSRLSEDELSRVEPLLRLGIAHEEQHQELILTDILAAFAAHSFHPVYAHTEHIPPVETRQPSYVASEGGLVSLGASSSEPFYFDNEGPQHQVFLAPYSLATHPISVREVLAFIEARGYQTPSFWLSDGWAFIQQHKLGAPGYSFVEGDSLWVFTLHGLRRAALHQPASHLSYYEADAIARFLGGRLPTEFEWEHSARAQSREGQFREQGSLIPTSYTTAEPLQGLYGGVWEWTSSSYTAYPGFAPGAGAIGEYNGKFMINQMVLRGGSCFSNQEHLRPSYRNFWPPHTRFQMTGARVARDST